ncbi:hypothetical protein [Cellulophaga sp. BC115SP]|uniref:hypothetical protein n=1 Tax=Cellulophaga sp. BC115SP TaxID=2683263 RepID=UPI0014130299|nr:hypothetical protein [Cellulophaga sp. BC115SP]NBB28015.1 hypothetical protein [Cellulophaga sp. BC115SP]
MRISDIFVIKKNVLYSLAYDNQVHEFRRLFTLWIEDLAFLDSFFDDNIKDLESGYWGDITIEEAIEQTRFMAIKLRQKFKNLLASNQPLQTLFQPLDNNQYQEKALSKEKSKEGWLRIYAIRISTNTYVITGGAIKLTFKMHEAEHLKIELQKLTIAKSYLIDEGLTDESDFGYFEFMSDIP